MPTVGRAVQPAANPAVILCCVMENVSVFFRYDGRFMQNLSIRQPMDGSKVDFELNAYYLSFARAEKSRAGWIE